MDPKDIRNLVESYQNLYAEQEVSEDMYSTVKSGLEKGSKALENSPAGGVLKMLVGPVGNNKGKRTPSAADQKKKIAANKNESVDSIAEGGTGAIRADASSGRTVKMSATGREPIGDKVIRTIGDKLKKTFGGRGTVKSTNVPQRKPLVSTTKPGSANESVELYNIVFNHLIEEGFASSEENAEKIISVMSDEWMSSIVNENLGNFARTAGEVIKNPIRAINSLGRDPNLTKRTPDDPRLVDVSTADKAAKNLPGSKVYKQRQQQMNR